MRVGVTGATGFIGSALVAHLERSGHEVIRFVRRLSQLSDRQLDIDSQVPSQVFDGLEALVHLAGIADRRQHASFEAVNHHGTVRVAKAAIAAGVPRFIFMSSATVFGNSSDEILDSSSPVAPPDDYARSKLNAETELRAIYPTGLTIVRPPLVVGENAKGNLASVLSLAERGVPIPVPRRPNRRSVVELEALVEELSLLLLRPSESPNLLICPTGTAPLSFAEICKLAAEIGQVRVRLVHVPMPLVHVADALLRMAGSQSLTPLIRDFVLAPDTLLQRLSE